MSSVPLWPRPAHRASGRWAEVQLFAFADQPLSLDAELDPEEHGAPSIEALEAIETHLTTAEWWLPPESFYAASPEADVSAARGSRRRRVPTTASIHRWLIPKFLVGSAKWCAM